MARITTRDFVKQVEESSSQRQQEAERARQQSEAEGLRRIERSFDGASLLIMAAVLDNHFSDFPDEFTVSSTRFRNILSVSKEGGKWRISDIKRRRFGFGIETKQWLTEIACQALGVSSSGTYLEKVAEIVQWDEGSFVRRMRGIKDMLPDTVLTAIPSYGRLMADNLGLSGVSAKHAVTMMKSAGLDLDPNGEALTALACLSDVEFIEAIGRYWGPRYDTFVSAAAKAPYEGYKAIRDAFYWKNLSTQARRRGEVAVVERIAKNPDEDSFRILRSLADEGSFFGEVTEDGRDLKEVLVDARNALDAVTEKDRQRLDWLDQAIRVVAARRASDRVMSAGWGIACVDDGYGTEKWYAHLGDENEPELETGLFDSRDAAAMAALEAYPDRFSKAEDMEETPSAPAHP